MLCELPHESEHVQVDADLSPQRFEPSRQLIAGATTRLFGFSDAALARIDTDGYVAQSIPEPETYPLGARRPPSCRLRGASPRVRG